MSEFEIVISPSQMQVWDRCENQWKFNYRWGYIPVRTKDYFQVGTFVHALLAVHYKARMEGRRDTWDEVLAYANNDVDFGSMDTNEITSWKRAVRIVQRYLAEYAPVHDNFRILDVERHFIVPMQSPGGIEYKLQGYFDLLIELDGRMYLFDHKTVGQSRFWTNAEAEMDPQMTLYQLGLNTQGYNIHATMINQLNTYDYKEFNAVPVEKLYKRLDTYRTPAQIENMSLEVGKVIDEIVKSLETDSYRKSLRKDCKSCPYREPCLLELKGIDVTNYMAATFRTKESRVEELIEPETEGIYAFEL